MSISEVSMERCLLDMPYEMLFEIFRRLQKYKFIEITRLHSKFRNIAEDIRYWKTVHIKYKPYEEPTCEIFAFEDLYSGPFPMGAIDLSGAKISPPVSFKTDHQVLKVATLDLSSVIANKVTMEAILAKYQCTELYLENKMSSHMEITPEVFSKQTALEVLSLRVKKIFGFLYLEVEMVEWLAQVLGNCKNLKILDLSDDRIFYRAGLYDLVKNLPTSLEKLLMPDDPEDYFYELLAKRIPNLRELGMLYPSKVECQSLLEFQFLETLHIRIMHCDNVRLLHIYLMKFPALKIINIASVNFPHRYDRDPTVISLKADLEAQVEILRTTCEPHGIIVERIEIPERSYSSNVWEVSKAV